MVHPGPRPLPYALNTYSYSPNTYSYSQPPAPYHTPLTPNPQPLTSRAATHASVSTLNPIPGNPRSGVGSAEREFFIHNLLVRIHLFIEMILVDRLCAMGV